MSATGAPTSAIHPKPTMNWDVLTGPIESVGQKVGRILGKCLIFVGCPSAGAATYYVYHYMTSTPEKILAAYDATRILTVASAVGGAALWFFNRLSVDPRALKQQRKNIEATIEKTPLATIRKNNTSIVISNRELNEWMRYLLLVKTYDQFILLQTDTIFELEREQASTDLLKEKYRTYLEGPSSLGLKTLTGQKAFTVLLNATEQKAIRKLHAEKEAQSAATYQAFIDRNGVEALNDINEPDVKQTLFSKFLDHVREKNLGLIQTRTKFAEDIQGFGRNAQQVVDDAIRKLEPFTGRTYKEFRERNGFEEIKLRTIGNTSTFEEIKKKFLELPFVDQLSDGFQEDCKLLNITQNDIQAAMKSRWLSKPFSEILTTEWDDFLACITAKALAPREWTTKAILETGELSIQAIVKNYADLFTAGVLTAKDGNFKARLATESSNLDLMSLINTYGDVIFKYGLIEEATLQKLVKAFVIMHAYVYLGITEDANVSENIVKVSTLGLVSDLLVHIGNGQKLVANEKEQYSQKVNDINHRYDRHDREIDDDMEIRTTAERETVASAEQNLRLAVTNVRSHEEKISSLERVVAQYETLRASAQTDRDRKQTQLNGLKEEQARLQSQPVIDLNVHERELLVARNYCSAADAYVNNDPYTKQLKQQNPALTKELQQLESQISGHQKQQEELAALQKKVENSKTRKEELEKSINALTSGTLTGVQAARQALALKKAAETNRAELERINAQEKLLTELTTQLKGKDITSLSRRAEKLRTQIDKDQADLDTRSIQLLAAYPQLSFYRQRAEQFSSAIETYKKTQESLAQNSQDIERLTTEIRTLKSKRDDAAMNKGIQAAELEIAQRNSNIATGEKTAAQRALEAANEKLEAKKTQVRADLEQKRQKKAAEKEAALRQENYAYLDRQRQLIEDFRMTIATNIQ